MASKPKPPNKPAFQKTVPGTLEPYVPGDALPVPEVIEKDSDSVWALWSDAVQGSAKGPAKGPVEKEADTQAATQLMGLDELPKSQDE